VPGTSRDAAGFCCSENRPVAAISNRVRGTIGAIWRSRLRGGEQSADGVQAGGVWVRGGEFLQLLQRIGGGGGIRQREGGLVIGAGRLWLAQGQAGQAAVKVEIRLLLALEGGGVVLDSGGVILAGETELAQAGAGVGMVRGQGARLPAVLFRFVQPVEVYQAAGAVAAEQRLALVVNSKSKGVSVCSNGLFVLLLTGVSIAEGAEQPEVIRFQVNGLPVSLNGRSILFQITIGVAQVAHPVGK